MDRRDVDLLQGILRLAAAGGGGGAVLLLGTLMLDVEQLKREVHVVEMDQRLHEAKLNACLSKIELHTVMPEPRRNGSTR